MSVYVVDIVDQSGVQPPYCREQSALVSLFGSKTDPKQHSKYRFSQELPKKSLFRMQMAPVKKRPTTTMKLVQKTSKELENTHMDTTLPPSIHSQPEERPIKIRAPCLVRGSLFRNKNVNQTTDHIYSFAQTQSKSKSKKKNCKPSSSQQFIRNTETDDDIDIIGTVSKRPSTMADMRRHKRHFLATPKELSGKHGNEINNIIYSTENNSNENIQNQNQFVNNSDRKEINLKNYNEYGEKGREDAESFVTLEVNKVAPHLQVMTRGKIEYRPPVVISALSDEQP